MVVKPRDASHPAADSLDRLVDLRGPGFSWLAWRLAGELRATDAAAPLAAEGFALELVAGTCRETAAEAHVGRSPAWLRSAEELLRDAHRRLHRIERACARGRRASHASGPHLSRSPRHLGRRVRATSPSRLGGVRDCPLRYASRLDRGAGRLRGSEPFHARIQAPRRDDARQVPRGDGRIAGRPELRRHRSKTCGARSRRWTGGRSHLETRVAKPPFAHSTGGGISCTCALSGARRDRRGARGPARRRDGPAARRARPRTEAPTGRSRCPTRSTSRCGTHALVQRAQVRGRERLRSLRVPPGRRGRGIRLQRRRHVLERLRRKPRQDRWGHRGQQRSDAAAGTFAWFQVFDNGEGAKRRPIGRASSDSATRPPTRRSATARTCPLRALGRPRKRGSGYVAGRPGSSSGATPLAPSARAKREWRRQAAPLSILLYLMSPRITLRRRHGVHVHVPPSLFIFSITSSSLATPPGQAGESGPAGSRSRSDRALGEHSGRRDGGAERTGRPRSARGHRVCHSGCATG